MDERAWNDGGRVNDLVCEQRAEIERMRAALTLLAGFGCKCLFSNTRGSDGDKAYREGSHAAWEQAADIANSALTNGKRSDG